LIPAGDTAELAVLRKGERITLPVTIAALADDEAKPVKTSIEVEKGESKLGVVISELSQAQKEELGIAGVLVEQVVPSSPAAAAGIRPGDVVISFDQTEITSVQQLTGLVREAPVGKPIPLLLQRGDSPLFSALTLQ